MTHWMSSRGDRGEPAEISGSEGSAVSVTPLRLGRGPHVAGPTRTGSPRPSRSGSCGLWLEVRTFPRWGRFATDQGAAVRAILTANADLLGRARRVQRSRIADASLEHRYNDIGAADLLFVDLVLAATSLRGDRPFLRHRNEGNAFANSVVAGSIG